MSWFLVISVGKHVLNSFRIWTAYQRKCIKYLSQLLSTHLTQPGTFNYQYKVFLLWLSLILYSYTRYYGSNTVFYFKIQGRNREACVIQQRSKLITGNGISTKVSEGKWYSGYFIDQNALVACWEKQAGPCSWACVHSPHRAIGAPDSDSRILHLWRQSPCSLSKP